jgi:hypothetical protein
VRGGARGYGFDPRRARVTSPNWRDVAQQNLLIR